MKWRLYSFLYGTLINSSTTRPRCTKSVAFPQRLLRGYFFLTNQQLFCKKQNVKKFCWDECQNCKYELKLFVFSTLQQQSVVAKTLTH